MANFSPSQPTSRVDSKAVFDYASNLFHSIPAKCQLTVRASFFDGFGSEAVKCLGVIVLKSELLNLFDRPNADVSSTRTPKNRKKEILGKVQDSGWRFWRNVKIKFTCSRIKSSHPFPPLQTKPTWWLMIGRLHTKHIAVIVLRKRLHKKL